MKEAIESFLCGLLFAAITIGAICIMPVKSSELDYSWGTGTGIMHEAHVRRQATPRTLTTVLLAMQEEITDLRHRVKDCERHIEKLQRKQRKEKE